MVRLMGDNTDTPMKRLAVAAEEWRRATEQLNQRRFDLAAARKQADLRADEEAAAATAVKSAEAKMQKAAKEVAG